MKIRLIDAIDAERRSREPSIYDLVDVPDFLAECPTVDAKPVRHGYWIDAYKNYETAKCSECGCSYEVTFEGNANAVLWDGFNEFFKFCPNCGAKMDAKPEKAGK